MRAFSVATAAGVARVIGRRRLPRPRLPLHTTAPATAATAAHIQHVATPLDRAHDAVSPTPTTGDPLLPTFDNTQPLAAAEGE